MILRNLLRAAVAAATLYSSLCEAAVGADEIQRAVAGFMQGYRDEILSQAGADSRFDYDIGALDSRLALTDCAQPIAVAEKNRQNTASRVMLKVSCPDNGGWSIYVPVDVRLLQPVVVSNQPLGRGTAIQASQLQMREMNTAVLPGRYFIAVEDVSGMVTKRLIRQGSVIMAHHLDAPALVRKGEAVIVTARSNGLSVRTKGIAQQDGKKGEQIRVKNPNTERTVEATVVAPGETEVVM